MRNKAGIVILTLVITALCVYNLVFSFIARGIQKDAEIYARRSNGKVDVVKKQAYLDSLWKSNKPIFNMLGMDYNYKEIKKTQLGLGLDLQGGMYFTLEVSPVELIKVMAGNSQDPAFLKALTRAQEKQRSSNEKFVTLFYESYREIKPDGKLSTIFANASNKRNISYASSDEDVLKVLNEEVDGAVDRSFEILRTRIDKFGVTQPNIQQLKGSGRIQVELPGAENPDRVRRLLEGEAKLEFLEVWEPSEYFPYVQEINNYLYEKEKSEKKSVVSSNSKSATVPSGQKDQTLTKDSKDTASAADLEKTLTDANKPSGKDSAASKAKDSVDAAVGNTELARMLINLGGGRFGAAPENVKKVDELLNLPKVKEILPSDMYVYWEAKPIEIKNDKGQAVQVTELYFLRKGRGGKALLTGEVVEDASQDIEQRQGRTVVSVNMRMNASGARAWKKITADNVNRRVAIVLDDVVYSAPRIDEEIPNGMSAITGNFTVDEAKDLANILKAGKLPAPTRIVEGAVIGPSLGKEAIRSGLLSAVAGLGIVILFMILYYSKGGLTANFALLFNVFFVLGILAQLNAALTLDGIAGIVLIIGMAVDANVLIYERVKEELSAGKSLLGAIDLGYKKALSSIVDSNVTTFLVGAVLFSLGTGPVKGFATTLMLGIVCSMFTAILISRVTLEWLAGKKGTRNISFATFFSKNLFKRWNYNIIGNRRKAYLFSVIMIAFGLVSLYVKGGLTLGVDFKGGRSYVVQFDKDVSAQDVKVAVGSLLKGAGTSAKTYNGNDKIKITTSYLVDDESSEADRKVETAVLKGLEKFKDYNPKVVSMSKVGASVADDVQSASQKAIIIALLGIFIYIVVRFRRWAFGFGALVALFHDVLMVFSAVGIAKLFGIDFEIDQIFVAAVLTVIGYSINDTVVVFDRVREFLMNNPKADISKTINDSINHTFSRTIITAVCTLLVVVILLIFGGEVLRGFSFALLIGIMYGTYSSIFIATPIVLDFSGKKKADRVKPAAV